jgi:hypothetical protein
VRDQGEKEEENGETRCKILSLEEKKRRRSKYQALTYKFVIPIMIRTQKSC